MRHNANILDAPVSKFMTKTVSRYKRTHQIRWVVLTQSNPAPAQTGQPTTFRQGPSQSNPAPIQTGQLPTLC
jgi:hypothetical protein